MTDKKNKKMKIKKCKKILIGVIIFLAVIIGLDFLRIAYFPTETEKFKKDVEKFEKELTDIYKKDIYGGETPEITYNLFMGALKDGDIDLASKYFFLSDWDKKESQFKEKKENNELEEYINNLPKWEELEENEIEGGVREYKYKRFLKEGIEYLQNGNGGVIKTEFPAGEYASSIIFRFNDVNKIWKISQGI